MCTHVNRIQYFINCSFQLGFVWEQLKPIVSNLLHRDLRNGSATTSPRISPINSPTREKPLILQYYSSNIFYTMLTQDFNSVFHLVFKLNLPLQVALKAAQNVLDFSQTLSQMMLLEPNGAKCTLGSYASLCVNVSTHDFFKIQTRIIFISVNTSIIHVASNTKYLWNDEIQ